MMEHLIDKYIRNRMRIEGDKIYLPLGFSAIVRDVFTLKVFNTFDWIDENYPEVNHVNFTGMWYSRRVQIGWYVNIKTSL